MKRFTKPTWISSNGRLGKPPTSSYISLLCSSSSLLHKCSKNSLLQISICYSLNISVNTSCQKPELIYDVLHSHFYNCTNMIDTQLGQFYSKEFMARIIES